MSDDADGDVADALEAFGRDLAAGSDADLAGLERFLEEFEAAEDPDEAQQHAARVARAALRERRDG